MRQGHLDRGAEKSVEVVHRFLSKFSGIDQEHFVTGQQIPPAECQKNGDGSPSKAKRQAGDVAMHEP